jgi:hypothetical protein
MPGMALTMGKKMSKSKAWKRYLHKLPVGAAALVLAVPLAVAPVALAPALPGQRAVAQIEIDCSRGGAEICKSIARDWCMAYPEACRAPGTQAPPMPAAPPAPSEKQDHGASGSQQTLALDTRNGPRPARVADLDAGSVAILSKLKADTWMSASEYLIVSQWGLASPNLAEFSVPLMQSGWSRVN